MSNQSTEDVSEETLRAWMKDAEDHIESGVATDMVAVCPVALRRACRELLDYRRIVGYERVNLPAEKQVDCPDPPAMAAWLRETAANTRRHSNPAWCDAHCKTYDPLAAHVAFRMEQAATMLEQFHSEDAEWEKHGLLEIVKERDRLRECLRLVQWRMHAMIDDQKHATVGTERWRMRQDCRVTLHAIDEVIGRKQDDVPARRYQCMGCGKDVAECVCSASPR